jgi:hypothetical protein
MFWQISSIAFLFSVLLALQAGCGGSAVGDLKKAAADAQRAAETVQQAVAETTSAASGLTTGSVDLNVDGPLKAEKCSAWFTPPSGDRPAVLQLTTAETLGGDTQFTEYPSVYVWASVPVANSTDLAGKTLNGHIMLRREPASGVWHSKITRPINISVVSVDAWSIQCELADVEVERVDDEGTAKVTGKLVALWQ